MEELRHDHHSGKGRIRKFFGYVVLLMIVVAIAAAAAVYVWQQRETDKLNQQINDLNAQLTATKSLVPESANQTDNLSANTYLSSKSVQVKVYAPQTNAKAVSPFAIIGQIPGNWSFEGSFPVKLQDSKGNVIAETTAQILGDWMTGNPVPFSAKLTWESNVSGTGMLVLQKDNPSGLAQNDDSVSIPINF